MRLSASGQRTTFIGINRKSKIFAPDLLTLFELLTSGTITVPIKAICSLEDVKKAHRDWGKGSVVIKLEK